MTGLGLAGVAAATSEATSTGPFAAEAQPATINTATAIAAAVLMNRGDLGAWPGIVIACFSSRQVGQRRPMK